MTGTCAYAGCAGAFEAKRSDARYCSDTCRAKASKDRAKGRREDAGRRASVRGAARGVVETGDGAAGTPLERLVAMEQRLAAAEAGVARAEADRAGWKDVRDQLRAALARVEGGGGAAPGELAPVVRADVRQQVAMIAKRVGAMEAAQRTLREEFTKLAAVAPGVKADELMMVGKAEGKLNTRVRIIERDLRDFAKGLASEGGDGE